MPARRVLLGFALTAALAVLAAAPAALMPSARAGTLIRVFESRYGPVLHDGRGQAIYAFTRDRRNATRCYGACARAWPPVHTTGAPRAGRRVDGDLLGTIRRRGGRRQVTYKGWPLYFYVNEGRRQIFCQNVFQYGGLWLVVRPSGRLVR